MKNLFNLDNPFMQLLTRIADLLLLQVLFVLVSLPIVTMGAGFTALCKVTQSVIRDEDSGILMPFLRAFRANFKQATLGWLMGLVGLAALISDYLLLRIYTEGVLYTVLFVLLVLFAIVVLGFLTYLFPLIARYENTLRQHMQNALVLMILNFPRTLLMVVLTLSPILLLVISPKAWAYSLIFWLLAGFSFLNYISSAVLKPVFDGLEA